MSGQETGGQFWDDLRESLKNPTFRAAYEQDSAEIAATDAQVNAERETGGLRDRIAEAVRANFKVRPGRLAVEAFQGQPLPLSGGEADEIALLTLQIVQPELDAADARHRDMLTGLRDATLRAETAETAVAELQQRIELLKADVGLRASTSEQQQMRADLAEAAGDRLKDELEQWRACFGETALPGARQVLAERDRLREELRLARLDKERAEAAVAQVRTLRDQLASGLTVGLIRSLVVQELDAVLDQPETP